MSAISYELDELLSLMQEEAAEIIQIISKIRRFGLQSYHPEDAQRTTNHVLMQRELADLDTLTDILDERYKFFDWEGYFDHKEQKRKKLAKFSNVLN